MNTLAKQDTLYWEKNRISNDEFLTEAAVSIVENWLTSFKADLGSKGEVSLSSIDNDCAINLSIFIHISFSFHSFHFIYFGDRQERKRKRRRTTFYKESVDDGSV